MKALHFLPTLRARLVFWFLIICLVPLLALAAIIYFHRVHTARELVIDKLSAVTSLRADQVNALLDDLSGDAKTLADVVSSQKASQMLSEQALGIDPESLQRIRTTLLEYLRGHDNVVEAELVSERGDVIISTSPGRVGSLLSKPETASMALRDRQIVFGEWYLSGKERVPSMDIVTPVAGAQGREPIALVLRLDMRSSVYEILENRTGMGRTGESFLVDRTAAAISELRWKNDAVVKPALTDRPAHFASRGQSGITEATDYRGEKVLAAYTYIPRTGWGLVCKQDLAEVYRPLKNFLLITVGLVAIIAVMVGIYAYFLARAITRPLRNLAGAAAEIGGGDYGARVAEEGTEELVTLARSFNAMAEVLENKMGAQRSLSDVSEPLVHAGNLQDFFRGLLPVLVRVTGADLAAAFIGEPGGEEFTPLHAIGADAAVLRKFSRERLEGELGIVLSGEGKIRLTQPDQSCRLRFVCAFGEYLPNQIITIPITAGSEVRAFISLATLRSFSPVAREVVEQAVLPLNAGFSRVLAAEDLLKLAGELSATNAELTQQSEELRQQSTELARQSEELYRRNRTLDEQRLQLEEATRLKSEFLSNMSHELRTPLNSVLALTRVLEIQAGDRLTDEEKEYLSIVERNGRNLLSLINDILDLSKIESGRLELLFDQLSAAEAARDVIEGLQQLAREKGIRVELHTRGVIPPMVTDGKRLQQILQNLIGNAVKFTAHGGVTVRLRHEAGEIVIEVEDTGIGIPATHLEAIFDEFRQVDGSTSRAYEGTGLGLAIVRKTVRLLGGDVAVKSRFGEGSVFTVRLPLDSRSGDSDQGRLLQAEAVPVGNDSRTHRFVLIIDDDAAAASLIAEHLFLSGYETVTALNGSEALKLARSVRPCAVIIDMPMTGTDGWEILRELKREPATADIPVIVVSLADDHETGIALGAVGIVEKPVNRAHLLNELNRLAGAGVRTVLVIDDCDCDRLVIAGLLKEVGLDVHLASSGPEALSMVQEGHPDLITLDLVMPGMDGAEVLEELRCDPGTARIPVLIITSKDVSCGELERLSASVSAILPKRGLDRAVLLDELVRCLEKLGWKQDAGKAVTDSRLLLVEDSEAAIIQLQFALKSAGFSVDTVTGGRAAVDYLQHHVPDGIVLDLMMPEVDGFEVLQEVRSSPLTSGVPVMVVTAKTLSPEEHRRLESFNVRQVVQKGDVNQDELLAIVHEMLGTDRVFSEAAATMAECRSAAPAQAARQIRGPGSGSVLAVDDNRDNIEVVKAVLGKDFAVLAAGDGEEGLLLAQTENPSVILLDMQLPKKDGMTLLRELKEDAVTRDIPVIAVTACAMAGDRERFLAAGCSEYLSKPYRIEDLESLVRGIVPVAEEN